MLISYSDVIVDETIPEFVFDTLTTVRMRPPGPLPSRYIKVKKKTIVFGVDGFPTLGAARILIHYSYRPSSHDKQEAAGCNIVG